MGKKIIDAVENGLLPAASIQGQVPSPRSLAERMALYHVAGVSVAVINDFEVDWEQSYGVQSIDSGVPVIAETLFQAASISKPVTAMAILELAGAGKLSLDSDINDLLSGWRIPDNNLTKARKVTLRGILSHTAGLTTHGFHGYSPTEEVPSLHQILDGEPPANSDPVRVGVEPGTATRYSGGGYTIAQLLLEEKYGRPLDEILKTEVLDRLGMNDSTFAQPLPPKFQASASAGHTGAGAAMEGLWHVYPEMAAAGLWTTPTDLAKFLIEIMLSSDGKSNKILSQETTNKMLNPVIDVFGLGLEIKPVNDVIRFGHSGSNVGYCCYMVGYTKLGKGAVVMTNSNNGGMLMMEIIRSIADVYGWSDFKPVEKEAVEISPDTYILLAGKYGDEGFFININANESGLLFEMMGNGVVLKLYPKSETDYFMAEMEREIEFLVDDSGTARSLRFGPEMVLNKAET